MHSTREETTAAAEWRAHWPLTLAALIGYSTIGLQSYGISPFVTHLESEFGWSRADVMIGISLSNAAGIVLNMIIGLIIDRFGSRRVALLGLVVKTGTFALLGAATGTLLNWAALWLMLAVGVVLVQSTVWTRAVASRFDKARGLALAVALSGTPITAMLAPPLASWLIGAYGWRMGFAGVGAIWLAVTLPIVFLFFREKPASPAATTAAAAETASPAEMAGLTFAQGIRTRAFARLLLSFACFSFYSMTIATNLVPLLTETGIAATEAASIAAIMGLVGIVARLSVGVLLDRFPGHLIGTGTLLMPIVGCAILLMDAPGILLLSVAVAMFGAAIGAEIDVALYLATRHFGLKAFGALFSAIIVGGAVAATLGPFIGGWLHDLYGSYDILLMMIMAVMGIGALAMLTMGRPPRRWAAE
ncbi:MAG: MFS transporter [Novosphingobium sp.]